MFMGHLGIALGAKGWRRDIALPLLCVAAVLPDLIDFTLEGAGHPQGAGLWTHSLGAMVGYACVFAAPYALATRNYLSAFALGAVAASHVLADLITSRLTLWQGGPTAGLHLYAHKHADIALECVVIVAGWLLYGRNLSPRLRRSGRSLAMVLVLVLVEGVTAFVKFS